MHRVQPERPAQLQFKVRTRLAPLQTTLHLTIAPLQTEAALQAPVLEVCHALAVLLPEPDLSQSGLSRHFEQWASRQQKRRQQAESCFPHKEKRWAT